MSSMLVSANDQSIQKSYIDRAVTMSQSQNLVPKRRYQRTLSTGRLVDNAPKDLISLGDNKPGEKDSEFFA
jgi:hypothetical protein